MSSAPVHVEVARPVLVGEATVDGVSLLEYTIDRPASITEGPAQITISRNVAHYAVSDVTVRGLPNTPYVVTLEDPNDDFFIALEGVDPFGQVTTDATGEAIFQIRSQGTFVGTDTDYLKEIVFAVTAATPGKNAEQDDCTGRIYLAKQSFWTHALDAVVGFFGGDPETPTGIVANVTGGVLIVGDVGALVKNLWRGLGFSDEEVSYLEVTLSGLGLATELAVGVGEIADVPISSVRAIVAFIGKSKFTDLLVIFLKQAIKSGEDLASFANYTVELVSNSGFLKFSQEVATSPVMMETNIRLVETYGEAFTRATDNLVGDATTGGISRTAAQGLAEVLDEIPDAAKASINAAADAEDLIRGLGRVLDKMKLDPEVLRKIFENNIYAPGIANIPTSYTPADMARDLGTLVDALDDTEVAIDGFTRLAKTLKNTGTGRYGFRYELEVATHLIREGATAPIFVSQKVLDEVTGLLTTDIDVIFDGVYYQVKRSKSAFKKGARGVSDWVEKALADGATEIRYVTPAALTIPGPRSAARRMLDEYIGSIGLAIDTVPFK